MVSVGFVPAGRTEKQGLGDVPLQALKTGFHKVEIGLRAAFVEAKAVLAIHSKAHLGALHYWVQRAREKTVIKQKNC